jgi:hypothetical protein
MTRDNIREFPSQSVWSLIGLTIITITFYFPFWLRKHTKILNKLLPEDTIGSWWFPVCLTTTVLNFGMVIPEIITNDHPVALGISKMIQHIDIILLVVWTFKIRNRMHVILSAQKKTREWYYAFWTLFFGIFYLQYKVNRLQNQPLRNIKPENAPDKK